jgi:hypothetical protein
MRQYLSVDIATDHVRDDRDTTAPRPPLESTQPFMKHVMGASSPAINRPGREADHSPPS